MQVDPDDGEGHSIILIAFESEGAAALHHSPSGDDYYGGWIEACEGDT